MQGLDELCGKGLYSYANKVMRQGLAEFHGEETILYGARNQSYLLVNLAFVSPTRKTRQEKWTMNCKITVRNMYMLKMVGRGRSFESTWRGCRAVHCECINSEAGYWRVSHLWPWDTEKAAGQQESLQCGLTVGEKKVRASKCWKNSGEHSCHY